MVFQIWINHADKDRFVTPKASHLSPNEVPELKDIHSHVRILQGRYMHLQSPFEPVTPATLLHVRLHPNTNLSFEAQEMTFVYVLAGKLHINDQIAGESVLITFQQEGNTVQLATSAQAADFMFASGVPHHEPIVYGGPFVMTTAEQMLETQQRMQRGEMGILKHL
jgi:hypothetical protein